MNGRVCGVGRNGPIYVEASSTGSWRFLEGAMAFVDNKLPAAAPVRIRAQTGCDS